MLVKALQSFAGKISMYAGEIREVDDEETLADLLNARYIEEVKAKPEEPKKAQKNRSKK